MQRRFLLSAFLAMALAFTAGSCDSSLTGPSSGGATLRGQVRQHNGSSSTHLTDASFYRAQAAATEATSVMVLDSSMQVIATVPIVDGSFTLRGLPESFFLRFLDENGNPIGDDMLFQGVKPNQEIDIVVAIRDGGVVLVREKRTGIGHDGSGGIEIEGTATNVVIANAPGDLITGSLDVNGYHIITRRAETSIRKGNQNLTLEDIVGKQVHVRGVFEGTDVFAQEIKLQDEEEEDDIEDDEKVTLCHIPPGNPGNAKTITVGASAVAAHLAHGDTLGPCS